MKKLYTLAAVLAGCISSGFAMSGSYTVPSGRLPTLQVAIDSLNLYGVTGNTTITLSTGAVTETAPVGGYVLGSTTLNSGPFASSPTMSVTFVCNNNMITANSGAGNHDAIFTIQGADNITIKNLNIQESSANTTATTMMEHGFSIVKFNTNDGCKNISFEDCNVTLNNANSTAVTGVSHYGAAGFFVGNCTYGSTTDLAAPALYEGSHESIYLLYDTVVNVNHAVWCRSKQIPADGSGFNDANYTFRALCAQNFTHNGVYLLNVGSSIVYDCHLYNLEAGGVAPTTNTIVGVFNDGVRTTATHNSLLCDQNDINLTVSGSGGNYAIGVFTQLYGNGTTEISRNTIQLNSTGSSCGLEGMRIENNQGTVNVHDNTMSDWSTSVATSQPIIGIRSGQITSPYGYAGTSTIKNNQFVNSTLNTTNVVYGIQDISSTTANPVIQNNIIDNLVLTGNASAFRGITIGQQFNNAANTATIQENRISNIDASAVSTPGIGIRTGSSSLVTVKANGNIVRDMKFGTGVLVGIEVSYGPNTTLDKDTIYSLSGGGSVYGIQAGFTNFGVAALSITKSLVRDLSSTVTSGSIQGICIAPGTSTTTTSATISSNVIYNISGTGTGDTASGIALLGGNATYTLANNMVSNVVAANNTALFSSSYGISSLSTGTVNMYYNTVNLNPASAAASGYGATGLLYHPAGTNKIQNNIVRVNVSAGTGNNATAVRAASGIANTAPGGSSFSAASNIYYTPTGANNYLYVEGTTNASLVNGYHQSGLTVSSSKNIQNDTFFNSTCDRSSYHKFMQSAVATREAKTLTENNLTGSAGLYVPSGLSFAEGTAIDNSVALDLKDAGRPFGASDIGGLEFAGTQPPLPVISIVSSTGFDTACPANLPVLTASLPSYFSRTSFQWLRDSTVIPGATTKSYGVAATTATYIFRVYDTATGCFYYSIPFKMTVVPPPPAVITYYDSLTFCQSSAVVVYAKSGPAYSYRWLRNGNFLPGETKDHYVIDRSGDYQVEINTPLGCPSLSAPLTARVYPLPTPVVMYVRPRVLGVTQKFYTYQWYRNNVKIPGLDATNALYYVLDDAAYSVEVTDSNGCSSISDVYLYSLGIKNSSANAELKVYPNPVENVLHVEANEPLQLILTDLTGRSVLQIFNANSMDVSGLSAGTYLLRISDSEGTLIKTQKVYKQ